MTTPAPAPRNNSTFIRTAAILGLIAFMGIIGLIGVGLYRNSNAAQGNMTPPPATVVPVSANATTEAYNAIESAARTQAAGTVVAEIETAQPSQEPAQTIVPPIPSTLTPMPATATQTDEQLYSACPTESLGKHPDSDQPLIFVKDPYPGVLCEFEVFFLDRDYKIDLVDGVQGALVADWLHGKRYDPITGKLLDACPTGSKCEGTWVMIGDGTVPAGSMYHLYVYADVNIAKARFLGSPNIKTADRTGSFACEYLDYSNSINGEGTHDNDNIRVPAGVDATTGTVAGHTGCVGYDGTPKEAGVIEANTPACIAPTDNDWIWREGTFWHYVGDPIHFQVPSWILKVVYEDNTNSNIDLTATNGQEVTNAIAAKAYCE